MRKRRKSIQKLLGYHVYFNSIKNSNGQTVAKIRRHQIISNDALFFRSVLGANTIIESKPKELKERKPKYTIYNSQTDKIVAKADSFFNIYTLENIYLGSFFNSTKSMLFIIRCTVFALLTLCLSLITLQTTGNPATPKEVTISENDGGIVLDRWNIFGKLNSDKVLYPGKKGEYYFNITNKNSKDVFITIRFNEENESKIPMIYRLVCKDEYICGENNNWIDIEHLYTNEILIKAKQTIQFRLDWSWQDIGDHHFDTQIGMDGKACYMIMVEITSVIHYPNHHNN